MVDGMSVRIDHDSIRRRLAELKADDESYLATGKVRPVVSSIKMRYP